MRYVIEKEMLSIKTMKAMHVVKGNTKHKKKVLKKFLHLDIFHSNNILFFKSNKPSMKDVI